MAAPIDSRGRSTERKDIISTVHTADWKTHIAMVLPKFKMGSGEHVVANMRRLIPQYDEDGCWVRDMGVEICQPGSGNGIAQGTWRMRRAQEPGAELVKGDTRRRDDTPH